MPVMDGLTAVEHIMADNPPPILVLTADPRNQAPELTCARSSWARSRSRSSRRSTPAPRRGTSPAR